MLVSGAQRLGALAVLMACLTVYAISLLHDRQPSRETPIPWGNQGPGLLAVEISGNPAKNGIYFLPKDAAMDAIADIAEFRGNDDRAMIQDARLSDGSVMSFSPRGEIRIEQMSASKKLALGLPIDLNLASELDLALVPGIGEKTAYQIVQLRNQRGGFQGLSDLTAVPGIKGKRLEVLKDYLTVNTKP